MTTKLKLEIDFCFYICIDFFDTPKEDNAAPAVVGFDGFFRGAFCYHYHNFWWVSFDPGRNWPDLGPRFESGERKARLEVLKKKLAMKEAAAAPATNSDIKVASSDAKNNLKQLQHEAVDEDIMNEREVELDEESIVLDQDRLEDDVDDLSWATVLKRTFEAYVRGEKPNMVSLRILILLSEIYIAHISSFLVW